MDQRVPGDEDHAHGNRAIGDIEFGPSRNFDEIDDIPQAYSIDQVPNRTAEQHPETGRELPSCVLRSLVRSDERNDNRDGNKGQKERLTSEKAKRGAAVFDVMQSQNVAHQLRAMIVAIRTEFSHDCPFAHLID
jgi:hypothetical protein